MSLAELFPSSLGCWRSIPQPLEPGMVMVMMMMMMMIMMMVIRVIEV